MLLNIILNFELQFELNENVVVLLMMSFDDLGIAEQKYAAFLRTNESKNQSKTFYIHKK